MTSENAPTASEYIVHHLTHLSSTGQKQHAIVDWSVLNLDTLFYSTLLGLLVVFLMAFLARRASSGVPSRLQAAVEMVVEMVSDQAKGIVHNAASRQFVAPLALTVFMWILVMNTMDLLPLDMLPKIGQVIGFHYMRVVPTADLNGALGMSLGVLLICLYYNVKIKGLAGFIHELFSAPFGRHPLLAPFNFLLNMIEFAAKTLSHGMRLFGNMYAGELVFMLIALMGAAWGAHTSGVLLFLGHIATGTIWAIFHIMIIVLQAFIFMMLTLVYIGQAHESH